MNRAKLAHALALRVEQAGSGDRLPVIVEFASEARSARDMHAFARELPVQRLFRLFPSASLWSSPREIAAISRDARVERIWLDSAVQACMDASVSLVQAPQVWEMGYTGRGVRIAVLDSGIDDGHPDLQGRIAAARDFTEEGVTDFSGHGTHVAGIAVGDGRSSLGRYRGIAPQASLLVGKVLRRDGGGLASEVMAGLEWALEEKADVVNLSLGTPGPADGRDPLSLACDAAVEAGLVVCAAVGNAGPGRTTVASPAAARRVIAVGAASDEDEMASFSSRGPTADGRSKPDLVAPGVGVVSLRASGTSIGQPLDAHYSTASGTGVAAACVSGAAALLLQAFPHLSPAEVKELLWLSAWSLGQPKDVQGGGRLDVLGAFKVAQKPRPRGCAWPLGLIFGRN